MTAPSSAPGAPGVPPAPAPPAFWRGELLAESCVLVLENHNFALEGNQLVEDVLDAWLLSHDFFLFETEGSCALVACCGRNLG